MTTTARTLTARTRLTAAVAVVTVLAALDLGLKAWAERGLADGHSIDLSIIQLQLAHNPGIGFSLGDALPPAVLLTGIGAIVLALTITTWRATRNTVSLPWPPLAVVLAGATANYIDRAVDGVVTDYLHTGWWPTFNLADTYIVCGAAVLVLLSLRPDRAEQLTP